MNDKDTKQEESPKGDVFRQNELELKLLNILYQVDDGKSESAGIPMNGYGYSWILYGRPEADIPAAVDALQKTAQETKGIRHDILVHRWDFTELLEYAKEPNLVYSRFADLSQLSAPLSEKNKQRRTPDYYKDMSDDEMLQDFQKIRDERINPTISVIFVENVDLTTFSEQTQLRLRDCISDLLGKRAVFVFSGSTYEAVKPITWAGIAGFKETSHLGAIDSATVADLVGWGGLPDFYGKNTEALQWIDSTIQQFETQGFSRDRLYLRAMFPYSGIDWESDVLHVGFDRKRDRDATKLLEKEQFIEMHTDMGTWDKGVRALILRHLFQNEGDQAFDELFTKIKEITAEWLGGLVREGLTSEGAGMAEMTWGSQEDYEFFEVDQQWITTIRNELKRLHKSGV